VTARALVIVPTYNEGANIATVIARLFAASSRDTVHLLVVDDASPDGTAAVVESLTANDDAVALMQRRAKLGLGSAYIAAFRWGLERHYDTFLEMDADLSHDPADVPRLIAALDDGADLAIGSRYVLGGRIENWSRARRLLSRAGNVYARMWLRFDVADATGGFRAYRRSALEGIELEAIRSEGYAFQIEMAHRVHRAGGRIVEVPITFVERAAGASKMSRRIVLEAITKVPRWALRDLTRALRGGSSRRDGR
jgi:dolichol-phosphate mannosyltransferase